MSDFRLNFQPPRQAPRQAPRFTGVYEIGQAGRVQLSLKEYGQAGVGMFRELVASVEKPQTVGQSADSGDGHAALIIDRNNLQGPTEDVVVFTNPELGEMLASSCRTAGADDLADQILADVEEEKVTGKLPKRFHTLSDAVVGGGRVSNRILSESIDTLLQRVTPTPLRVKWMPGPNRSVIGQALCANHETHLSPLEKKIVEGIHVPTQSRYQPPAWQEPDPFAGARRILPTVASELQNKAGYGIPESRPPKLVASSVPVISKQAGTEALAPVYQIEQEEAGTLTPEKDPDALYKSKGDGLSLRKRVGLKVTDFLSQAGITSATDPETTLGGFLGRLNLTRTMLSMTYPVPWERTKIIRDIYQNFLDAHQINGHGTLEGVRFKVFQKAEGGPYVLRIEADGEYSHEAATLIGHSSKTGKLDKAGGFGEGLKIVALKLLRDQGAERLTYSSRNWRASFTRGAYDLTEDGERAGKKAAEVVHIDSEIIADRPGNYLEIESQDLNLLQDILDGCRLCFYPQNTHFATEYPGVSNQYGSFQFLGLDQKGDVYLNGQRYEYTDGYKGQAHWDGGVEFLNIRLNYKLEGNRDRPEVGIYETAKLFTQFVGTLSDEQLVQGLFALKPLWDGSADIHQAIAKLYDGKLTKKDIDHGEYLGSRLPRVFLTEMRRRNLKVDFASAKMMAQPEMFDSLPPVPASEMRALEARGYTFVPPGFTKIGARNVGNYWATVSQKAGLPLMPDEISRVNLLKKAAGILAGGPMVPERAFKLLRWIYDDRRISPDDHLWRVAENYEMLPPKAVEALPVYFHEEAKKPADGYDPASGIQLKFINNYQRLDAEGDPTRDYYIQVDRSYFAQAPFHEILTAYTDILLSHRFGHGGGELAQTEVRHRIGQLLLPEYPSITGEALEFCRKLWDDEVPLDKV